jgi:hypothetical protein
MLPLGDRDEDAKLLEGHLISPSRWKRRSVATSLAGAAGGTHFGRTDDRSSLFQIGDLADAVFWM